MTVFQKSCHADGPLTKGLPEQRGPRLGFTTTLLPSSGRRRGSTRSSDTETANWRPPTPQTERAAPGPSEQG